MSPQAPKKTRVLIVGAGCSGMSAAYALSKLPDRFEVTLYDRAPTVGGSATSYSLPDPERYGSSYINDGVQGASPVFHNTFKMFEKVLGFKAQEVGMQISFGKGVESFWSNVFPSELVDKFSGDIKKFGKVLKTIKRFEVIFAMVPVSRMLRLFRFSPDFGERMVYPLVALFFGTGNETPNISSAILERVFLDPSMRLFEFSEESLLASVPTMMAFPELARVYGAWKQEVLTGGNVKIETSREVHSIDRDTKDIRSRGGNIRAQSRRVDGEEKPITTGDAEEREEIFDELIMACDADSALKILGKAATWRERQVLGSVLYKWDITVTHNDLAYMEKHYQMSYDEKYNADRKDKDSLEAFEFARKNWRPLYLIKMYEHDRSKIEMSFDLTHYQAQFQGVPPTGPGARRKLEDAPPTERRQSPHGAEPSPSSDLKPAQDPSEDKVPPLDRHVFQTIYLDKAISNQWTKEEVSKDKIILERWWKQQSHRWQLYAKVVPFMWSINGQHHTNYAGAWSLVNMHEVGIVSGFSAAYALGAPYPFLEDEECARLFRLYHGLSRLSRLRGEDRKGMFA